MKTHTTYERHDTYEIALDVPFLKLLRALFTGKLKLQYMVPASSKDKTICFLGKLVWPQ